MSVFPVLPFAFAFLPFVLAFLLGGGVTSAAAARLAFFFSFLALALATSSAVGARPSFVVSLAMSFFDPIMPRRELVAVAQVTAVVQALCGARSAGFAQAARSGDFEAL